MKKIMVLCVVLAAALIFSSILYAAKSGQLITKERQLPNQDVVNCTKQVDLIPSLFFF